MYVFMDEEFNQYEIEADNIGDALKFIIDGMEDVAKSLSTKATQSRRIAYHHRSRS